MHMLTRRAGEAYYLRLLLQHYAARSYEQLRVIEGVTYDTFREAAEKCGLFASNNENQLSMREAVRYHYAPSMLRGLFVTLVDLDGANATKLLEEFGWSMAIDLERVRVVALDPIVAQDERQAPSTVVMQQLLKDLSARFQSNGTSLAAYGTWVA